MVFPPVLAPSARYAGYIPEMEIQPVYPLVFASSFPIVAMQHLLGPSLLGFTSGATASVQDKEWQHIPDKISYGKINIDYLPLIPLDPPSDALYYPIGDVTFRVGRDAWVDGEIKIGKDGIVESGELNVHGFVGIIFGSLQVTQMDGHHPEHLDFKTVSFKAKKGRITVKPGGTGSILPACLWNRLSWSDKFGKMTDEGEIDITDWIARMGDIEGIPFQLSKLIQKLANRKPSSTPPSKGGRWFTQSMKDIFYQTKLRAEFSFDKPLYQNRNGTFVDLKDLMIDYRGLEDITIKTGQISLENQKNGSKVMALDTVLHLQGTGFDEKGHFSGKGVLENGELLVIAGDGENILLRVADDEVIPELKKPNVINFDFDFNEGEMDLQVTDIRFPHIESDHPALPAAGRFREDKPNWLHIYLNGSQVEISDGSVGLKGLLDDSCLFEMDHPYVGGAPVAGYHLPYSLQCPSIGVTRYLTGKNQLQLGGKRARLEGNIHSQAGSTVVHVSRGLVAHEGKGTILNIAIETRSTGAPLAVDNLDLVFNPDGTLQVDAEKIEWALRTFFKSKAFTFLSRPHGKAKILKMRITLDENGMLTIESQNATNTSHPVFFDGDAKTTLAFPNGSSFDSDHVHIRLKKIRFDTVRQEVELWGHLHSRSDVPLNKAIRLMEGMSDHPENVKAEARVFDPEGKEGIYRVDVKATRMRVTPQGLTLQDNSLKVSSPKSENIPLPPFTPVSKLDFAPPEVQAQRVKEQDPIDRSFPVLLRALAQAVKGVYGTARIPHQKSSLAVAFDFLHMPLGLQVDFPDGALNAELKTQTDPQTNEEKITSIHLWPSGADYYPITFQIGCVSLDLGKIGVGIKSVHFVPDQPMSERGIKIPILTPLIGLFTGEYPEDPPGSLILEVRHGPDFDLSTFVMQKLGIKKEDFEKLGIKITGDTIRIPTRFTDFRRLLNEAAKRTPSNDNQKSSFTIKKTPRLDWKGASLELDLALVDSTTGTDFPIDLGAVKIDPAAGSHLKLVKTPDSPDFLMHELGFDRMELDPVHSSTLRGGKTHISDSRLRLFEGGLYLSTQITLQGEEDPSVPEFRFSGMEGNFDSLRLTDLYQDNRHRAWHRTWPAVAPVTNFGTAGIAMGGDFKIHEENSLIDFTGHDIRFKGLEASYFRGVQAYHGDEAASDRINFFHPHVAIEGLSDTRLTDVTVAFSQPTLTKYGKVDHVPDVTFTAASFEKKGGYLYLKTGEKVPLGGHATTGKIAVKVKDDKILFKVADADFPLGEMPLPFLRQIRFPQELVFDTMDFKNVRFTGDIQGSFVNRDIILEGDFGIQAEGKVSLHFGKKGKQDIRYESGLSLNLTHVRRLFIQDGELTRIEFDDLALDLDDIEAKIALADYFYSLVAPSGQAVGKNRVVPRGSFHIKRGVIDQSKKGSPAPFVALHGFEFQGELIARDSYFRARDNQINIPSATVHVDSNMTLEIIQPTAAQTYDVRLTDYGTDVTLDSPKVDAGK